MTADLHTLTGAYALQALSGDERDAFERHLHDCEACAQEVLELRETAARLGGAVAVRPSAEVKAEVLRRIATVRQEPPHTAGPERGTAGPATLVRSRLPKFALAACVAAAVGLGGVAGWQHQRAEDAQTQAQAVQQQSERLARVLAAPDAKAATGELSGGASGTVVVARSLDQAVFVASGMRRPPDGKVYQLWFDDGGTMRSAGLMNSSDNTEAVLLAGPVGEATGMGITVEPEGGSPEPTSDPVALMSLPTA